MKLKHLESRYADMFKHKSVAEAYVCRPPYPVETFELLRSLTGQRPIRVLDAGCGTGNVARYLVNFADQIDAVDFSESMIAVGRSLPRGDHPNINWICGSMEEAPLDGPYQLITAGASLHWMDWSVVLPRFRDALLPGGYLAIVDDRNLPTPWEEELVDIIKRHSTNREYRPYRLTDELEREKRFIKVGEKSTAPQAFRQSIEEYIRSFHARNGFSYEAMGEESADRFDCEVRNLLSDYCGEEGVELRIVGEVAWGKPV